MTRIHLVISLCIALAATSCARTPTDSETVPIVGRDFDLHVSADDENQLFHITLIANSNDICILAEDWPREDGLWFGQSGLFELNINGNKLVPPDRNAGLCIGDSCILHVSLGSTLTSQLRYAVFGNDREIAEAIDKTLVYMLVPSFCD